MGVLVPLLEFPSCVTSDRSCNPCNCLGHTLLMTLSSISESYPNQNSRVRAKGKENENQELQVQVTTGASVWKTVHE